MTHFLKTLTLLTIFEQSVLKLWYFTWIFPVIKPICECHFFYPVTLTLEFDPFFVNFNIANNFWTLSARALIFHMSIPCDKTIIFYPVTLTLEFDPFFKNFNLVNNFWTVSARALIFHMSIPCDKTFRWVPLFFTLWPWHWSITLFLKTLTLLITKKNYHWS